jgi:hypothetical protein
MATSSACGAANIAAGRAGAEFVARLAEATGRVDPPTAAEAANQLAIAQLHAQPAANTASMRNQFFGSVI